MSLDGTKWIRRFLTVAILSAPLFSIPQAKAAEQARLAMNTKDDLLLFWEEKELYVQTATRSEKPITQAAENMIVVTAKEIEAMNATTVNEVLARVPGLFVDFTDNDFSGAAQLHIQGSESHHVTVLLDGMRINFLAGGNADTTFIPLAIVERIEIIKGAASSAWGSALGGVINIITRATGDTPLPSGTLSASYGEANSRDLAAEVRGKNGPLSYYLYGGQMASSGLLNDRSYRRDSVFGKLVLTPNRDLDITLSSGYSDPKINSGPIPSASVSVKQRERNLFVNGSFEYRAMPELTVSGAVHLFQSRFDQPTYFLPSFMITPGQLVRQLIYDEQSIGGNLHATWSSGIQTLTLGGEVSHGTMDQVINAGPFLQQSRHLPATVVVNSSIDKWAFFANDTVEFGPLTVTPGIRLDHDNITGYFVSPSFGLAWELGEHIVARASAARGFTTPPLSYLAGGGQNAAANPALKAEYGWSYQVGLEAGLADQINLKGTLFRHDTTNAIIQHQITGQLINQGDVTRQGYELEAETIPFYNVSLKLGHAYTHVKSDTAQRGFAHPYLDNYSWLIGVKYDDRRSFTALLSGSYIWWDYDPHQGSFSDKYKTFIWDLTATKKFRTSDKTTLETFLTLHNLFSGAHHTLTIYPNPGRWVEGGLRFRF